MSASRSSKAPKSRATPCMVGESSPCGSKVPYYGYLGFLNQAPALLGRYPHLGVLRPSQGPGGEPKAPGGPWLEDLPLGRGRGGGGPNSSRLENRTRGESLLGEWLWG